MIVASAPQQITWSANIGLMLNSNRTSFSMMRNCTSDNNYSRNNFIYYFPTCLIHEHTFIYSLIRFSFSRSSDLIKWFNIQLTIILYSINDNHSKCDCWSSSSWTQLNSYLKWQQQSTNGRKWQPLQQMRCDARKRNRMKIARKRERKGKCSKCGQTTKSDAADAILEKTPFFWK